MERELSNQNLSVILNDGVLVSEDLSFESEEARFFQDMCYYNPHWNEQKKNYLSSVSTMTNSHFYEKIGITDENFDSEKTAVIANAEMLMPQRAISHLRFHGFHVNDLAAELRNYENSLHFALDKAEISLSKILSQRSGEIFSSASTQEHVSSKISILRNEIIHLKSLFQAQQEMLLYSISHAAMIYSLQKTIDILKRLLIIKKVYQTIFSLTSLIRSTDILKVSKLIPILKEMVTCHLKCYKLSVYFESRLDALTNIFVKNLKDSYNLLMTEMFKKLYLFCIKTSSATNEHLEFSECHPKSTCEWSERSIHKLTLLVECFFRLNTSFFFDILCVKSEKTIYRMFQRFSSHQNLSTTDKSSEAIDENAENNETQELILTYKLAVLNSFQYACSFRMLFQKITSVFQNRNVLNDLNLSSIRNVCSDEFLSTKCNTIMSEMIHSLLINLSNILDKISEKFGSSLDNNFNGLVALWEWSKSICDFFDSQQPVSLFLHVTSHEFNPLRKTICRFFDRFCQNLADVRYSKINLMLESDNWHQVTLPGSLSRNLLLLFDDDFSKLTSQNCQSDTFSNVNALCDISESEGPEESDDNSDASRFLFVENNRFPISASQLLLLKVIFEFCCTAQMLPFISVTLWQHLTQTVSNYNSYTKELILMGKAIKIGTVKNINVIHLALTYRFCELINLFMNAAFKHYSMIIIHSGLAQTNNCSFEPKFLQSQKEIFEHQAEIFDEMVYIFQRSISKNVSTWNLFSSHPSIFVQWIVGQMEKFIRSVSNVLDTSQLESLFHSSCVAILKVLAKHISQLSCESISQATAFSNHVLPELNYLCEKVRLITPIREDTITLFEDFWNQYSKMVREKLKK